MITILRALTLETLRYLITNINPWVTRVLNPLSPHDALKHQMGSNGEDLPKKAPNPTTLSYVCITFGNQSVFFNLNHRKSLSCFRFI